MCIPTTKLKLIPSFKIIAIHVPVQVSRPRQLFVKGLARAIGLCNVGTHLFDLIGPLFDLIGVARQEVFTLEHGTLHSACSQLLDGQGQRESFNLRG